MKMKARLQERIGIILNDEELPRIVGCVGIIFSTLAIATLTIATSIALPVCVGSALGMPTAIIYFICGVIVVGSRRLGIIDRICDYMIDRIYDKMYLWSKKKFSRISRIICKEYELRKLIDSDAPEEDIMEMLDLDIDVNMIMRGTTPLMRACIRESSSNVIDKLIEKGANINFVDERGDTPLSKAIWYKNMRIIYKLLENGADINMLSNSRKNDLLFLALRDRNIGLSNKLIELGADVDKKYEEYIYLANSKEMESTVGLIMDRMNNIKAIEDNENGMLHDAYRKGNKNIINILRIKGVDFGRALTDMQDVITDGYFYEVVKDYMNNEVSDLNFAINKFKRREFSEDVIETKLNKFKKFLDTSKKVVKANEFKICKLKDTSKFRDIWLEYNYNLDQIILNFYMATKRKGMNELQKNEIQCVNTRSINKCNQSKVIL